MAAEGKLNMTKNHRNNLRAYPKSSRCNHNPTRDGLLKYCVSLVFLLLCPLSPVCLVRSTKQTEEEGQ